MPKKTVRKSNAGRPTKFTPAIIVKLKAAFANSFTVDEACWYAEISKDTLYKWIERHPEFADQIMQAKSMPNMKAKEVVVGAVNKGDIESAKWWLTRKASDEFGTSNPGLNINLIFNQASKGDRDEFTVIDAI